MLSSINEAEKKEQRKWIGWTRKTTSLKSKQASYQDYKAQTIGERKARRMNCDGYNKSESQMTNNDIKEEWKRQDFDETELKAENQTY